MFKKLEFINSYFFKSPKIISIKSDETTSIFFMGVITFLILQDSLISINLLFFILPFLIATFSINSIVRLFNVSKYNSRELCLILNENSKRLKIYILLTLCFKVIYRIFVLSIVILITTKLLEIEVLLMDFIIIVTYAIIWSFLLILIYQLSITILNKLSINIHLIVFNMSCLVFAIIRYFVNKGFIPNIHPLWLFIIMVIVISSSMLSFYLVTSPSVNESNDTFDFNIEKSISKKILSNKYVKTIELKFLNIATNLILIVLLTSFLISDVGVLTYIILGCSFIITILLGFNEVFYIKVVRKYNKVLGYGQRYSEVKIFTNVIVQNVRNKLLLLSISLMYINISTLQWYAVAILVFVPLLYYATMLLILSTNITKDYHFKKNMFNDNVINFFMCFSFVILMCIIQYYIVDKPKYLLIWLSPLFICYTLFLDKVKLFKRLEGFQHQKQKGLFTCGYYALQNYTHYLGFDTIEYEGNKNFLSFSDVIEIAKMYNLDLEGYYVGDTDLETIQKPFIALMKYQNKGNHYVTVYKVINNYVFMSDSREKGSKSITIKEFKKHFTNNIICERG